MWTSLAPTLHPLLQVGQVVAVQGFRLRGHADRDEVELMVNPYNPEGSIHVVDREEYEGLDPAVPGVPVRLGGVEGVRRVADGLHVDVVGLCVWVGRLCRERGKDRVQFHCFRYVLIGDEGSDAALPLKLYCNSQDERVWGLQGGDVVLVTNATLVTTRELESSRDERSCYAQTSHFSHVYTAEEMEGMGVEEVTERAKALIAWRDSGEWKQRRWRSVWQWDVTLERFLQRVGSGDKVYITPIRELLVTAADLRFLQCRDIVVQGVITAVTLLSPLLVEEKTQEAESSTRPTKRRKGRAAKPVLLPPAPAGEAVAVPVTSGVRAVLQWTVSDLNHENEVQVQVMDRPVPYAALGGSGDHGACPAGGLEGSEPPSSAHSVTANATV